MARPQKQGLNYFPLDVDFFENKTVEAITGQYGLTGQAITLRLMCAIYNNGYYIEWNDLLKMQLLSRVHGAKPQLIDDVVQSLVKWDFFDAEIFSQSKVLTSIDIQKVFFEASKRRKHFCMQQYVCKGVIAYINPTESEVIDNISTQSKVNESKVNETKQNESKLNETKVNETKPNETIEPSQEARVPEILQSNLFRKPLIPEKIAVEEIFLRAGGTPEMASQFYNKHQSTSWFLNGSPIVNFQSLVPSYIKNWNDNIKHKGPPNHRRGPTQVTRKMDYSEPM